MPHDRPQIKVFYQQDDKKLEAIILDVELPVRPVNIVALELLIDDIVIVHYPFTMTEEMYVRCQHVVSEWESMNR